jgi:hypothetical protein
MSDIGGGLSYERTLPIEQIMSALKLITDDVGQTLSVPLLTRGGP